MFWIYWQHKQRDLSYSNLFIKCLFWYVWLKNMFLFHCKNGVNKEPETLFTFLCKMIGFCWIDYYELFVNLVSIIFRPFSCFVVIAIYLVWLLSDALCYMFFLHVQTWLPFRGRASYCKRMMIKTSELLCFLFSGAISVIFPYCFLVN